jgi:hypothetical protein
MQDSMAGFFVGLGGISLASLNFVKSAGDIPKFLKTFWNCYCKICTSLLLMLKSNLDELYISHGTSIITLPFIFFPLRSTALVVGLFSMSSTCGRQRCSW